MSVTDFYTWQFSRTRIFSFVRKLDETSRRSALSFSRFLILKYAIQSFLETKEKKKIENNNVTYVRTKMRERSKKSVSRSREKLAVSFREREFKKKRGR